MAQKPPSFSYHCFERGVKRQRVHSLKDRLTHPKCLSFHLPSLAEIFSLHYKAHTLHTRVLLYIIMAGEEETETFAFQAEINQLLSLIINVSTFFMCDVYNFQSVVESVLFPRANL